MTLALEIEFLSGVSFAARGPDADLSEWPPQPDRIYSALVAAWAARGESEVEAAALRWLEQQAPPAIDAADGEQRDAPISFVPPNDPRSDTASAKTMMPAKRRRQPRRFPAVRPEHPVVHLLWRDVSVDVATLAALQSIARDVVYVGHSASLARCRFLNASEMKESTAAVPPRRIIYPGRLEELRRAYAAGRRPQPGAPLMVAPTPVARGENLFAERWLLLEDVGENVPDVRACALVARAIRDAVLSGYQRSGHGDAIPEIVSGHTDNGGASQVQHLAIIPLPFAGFPHADGHIMGFAIVPPNDSEIFDDAIFRQALRHIGHMDENRGRRVITINPRAGTPRNETFSVQLSPAFEPTPNRRSLSPSLYLGPARDFATITPIVLDRHLKAKGAGRDAEIAELVKSACRNIGVPEPQMVVADKHSAFEGVPSAYPSGNAPPWTRWHVPHQLSSRQLTHAWIRFPEPISGPVILGAGRFFGLGLCRPVTADPSGE